MDDFKRKQSAAIKRLGLIETSGFYPPEKQRNDTESETKQHRNPDTISIVKITPRLSLYQLFSHFHKTRSYAT